MLRTFTSHEFGFSITYDASKLTESIDSADSGSNVPFLGVAGTPGYTADIIVVYFYDKNAKDALPAEGGPGHLQVTATRAKYRVPVPTLAALRKAASKSFLGMPGVSVKSLPLKGVTIGPIESVTLFGLPGFKVDFSSDEVEFVSYALYDGTYGYSFTLAATKAAWPAIEPMFRAALRSFRARTRGLLDDRHRRFDSSCPVAPTPLSPT